MNVANSRSFRS